MQWVACTGVLGVRPNEARPLHKCEPAVSNICKSAGKSAQCFVRAQRASTPSDHGGWVTVARASARLATPPPARAAAAAPRNV
jgi:hypothetical protein